MSNDKVQQVFQELAQELDQLQMKGGQHRFMQQKLNDAMQKLQVEGDKKNGKQEKN